MVKRWGNKHFNTHWASNVQTAARPAGETHHAKHRDSCAETYVGSAHTAPQPAETAGQFTEVGQ